MLDYRHCTLCPRRCGVDRTAGQLGFCRMPDQIHAARAALHYWEEPVISGSYGSGAIFFSALRVLPEWGDLAGEFREAALPCRPARRV